MSKQEAVLMSASNDLSSILTNVNWAVYRNTYQNGEAEPLPTQPTVPGLVVNEPEQTFPGDLLGQSKWYQLSPHQWSKQHVLEWMGHHVDENEFDASTLNLAYCSMDGPTLCQLSHSTLLSMFGSLGERLYHHLQELKTKFGAEDLTVAWDMLNDLWEDLPDFLNVHAGDDYKLLSTVVVHGEERGPDLCSHMDGLKTVGDKTPLSDNGYESGSTLSDSWNTRMLSFPVPSSPESVGSDSESDMQFSAKGFIKTERGEMKPHKRGRGRPRKLSRGSGQVIETTKSKHSPRGVHLWEFIRDILIHPEQNNGLMKWEDRTEGVFKFLKSEAVAQLWGQKKRNSSMTYEKLSRAMRYYYKREILERVDGRRLVYKFGKNSRGWKLEEAGI